MIENSRKRQYSMLLFKEHLISYKYSPVLNKEDL